MTAESFAAWQREFQAEMGVSKKGAGKDSARLTGRQQFERKTKTEMDSAEASLIGADDIEVDLSVFGGLDVGDLEGELAELAAAGGKN